MFNFTTTTVVNSKIDSSGKDRWVATANKSLNFLRVNNFKKENVSAIYKAGYVAPKNESIEINLEGLGTLKDQLKLDIYIGLTQASQDSRYSNDLIYKGKPFSVEFIVKEEASKTAAALKKTIDKYQVLVYGDKQLDATISEGKITITAKTEYQRFKKVTVSKYSPDNTTYPYAGLYEILQDLNDDDKKDKLTLTKGVESFGSYDYILHNLRLPTFENTRFMSPNAEEMPIIGEEYTQFTINYCVDRGPLGLNGVGDLVKSVTTHVFFVSKALTSQFETALTTAFGGTFEDVKKGDSEKTASADLKAWKATD